MGPGDQLGGTCPKQRVEKLEQSSVHTGEMTLGASYSRPKGQWASGVKNTAEAEYPLVPRRAMEIQESS